MQIPKFLRDLLQSNNYWNKDSIEFAKANEYLEKLYPGQLSADLSGRYVEAPYDMTLEQFESAQRKFDEKLEKAIHEAKDSVDYADGTAEPIDYDQYVDIEETIDVRVLMPNGMIEHMQLIVYTLNMPDDESGLDDEPDKSEHNIIRIWHGEDDDNMCDTCAGLSGRICTSEEVIPLVPQHQNCRCWVEEQELDDNGKPISSKVYKGQKSENKTDKNEVKDMKNVLTKDLKQEILKFEGLKLNFYLDSKGILTVGIGQNVNNFNDFKNLNIINKQTGNALSDFQKSELYSQIMQDVSNHTFYEKNYSYLEISKYDIYAQFDKNLEKSYTELEQKIKNFNNFPISVKQALVDMQFNMGSKKFSEDTWPKLFKAIDNRDWQTAAKEASQRKDVQKSRREWTYKMFMGAK